MKSIPVSKIDAKIAEIEKTTKQLGESPYGEGVLLMLELMKKESEEMIPLSTVEAMIKRQEEYGIKYNQSTQQLEDMGNRNYTDYDLKTKIRLAVIYHLKELTKDKDPS